MSTSSEPPKTKAQKAAEKQAEDQRKLKAALEAALAVPQNQRVLAKLAKR